MNNEEIHELTMPKWGFSMKEGMVVGWFVEEGAEVGPGVQLLEVETEKMVSAVEAVRSGVLRRQLAKTGQVVPVRGLLGVMASASVPDSAIDAFVVAFQAHFVLEKAEEGASSRAPETVQVEGQTVRYLKRGEGGVPAVLIHGFGGDLNNWLFNHEDLATSRTVYALDLPGHGGSSKKVGGGTLDELSELVNSFMNAIGAAKAHLAGHSMGGAVAIKHGLAHPDRTASLTLIASAGLGPEIDGEYVEGFITASRRKEIKPHLEKLFSNPSLLSRQLIEDVLHYKRLDGVERALRAIASRFCPGGRQAAVFRDRLVELPMPILVIWGAEDAILPLRHAHDLPEHIQTHILPSVGHMAQMEAAPKVNRLIHSFWSSV